MIDVQQQQLHVGILGLISKSGKSGGSLFIDHINVEYRPSFLDYVMVGVLHINIP